MTDDLALYDPEDLQRIKRYAVEARAPGTRRLIKAKWKMFEAWCSAKSLPPLPASPQTVCAYLTDLAEGGIPRDMHDPRPPQRKVSTIETHASTISTAHKLKGFESPVMHQLVRETMAGIRRSLGVRQEGKDAADGDIVARFLEVVSDGNPVRTARDRAMFLLDFFSGLRRSEICGMGVEDAVISKAGMVVKLARSKSDQEGVGAEIQVARMDPREHCPVAATELWMRLSGVADGALWRGVGRDGAVRLTQYSDSQYVKRIKRVARLAGLDAERFAGHSFRSGFVTEAIRRGVPLPDIQEVTRHGSLDMVARYHQGSKRWAETPGRAMKIERKEGEEG
jgi:integrase